MIDIFGRNFSLAEFLLIFYFLAINLIAFFIFAIDKIKSTGSGRRISEKMLWLLALVGGSVGALIGMRVFRHKTKKLSFQTVLAIIIFVQVLIIYFIYDLRASSPD